MDNSLPQRDTLLLTIVYSYKKNAVRQITMTIVIVLSVVPSFKTIQGRIVVPLLKLLFCGRTIGGEMVNRVKLLQRHFRSTVRSH